MEVNFTGRKGENVRPVFTKQIEQLCSNIRSSQMLASQRRTKDIHDHIRIKYKGFPFPTLPLNQKLFTNSLHKLYNNMNTNPFNQIDQIYLKNQSRRQTFQAVLMMHSAGFNNMSGQIPIFKPLSPVEEVMQLTGMEKAKAEVYLKRAKGNIEEAYKTFNFHQAMVEEMSRDKGISRKDAEGFLEAANYDKVFANTLYEEAR